MSSVLKNNCYYEQYTQLHLNELVAIFDVRFSIFTFRVPGRSQNQVFISWPWGRAGFGPAQGGLSGPAQSPPPARWRMDGQVDSEPRPLPISTKGVLVDCGIG